MKAIHALLLAAIALGATASIADEKHHRPAAAGASATVASTTALTEGEVRRIDREGAKVTLRHGEIRNLEMPAMTMVFRVTDAAMLEGLKVGDRIRFAADHVDGAYLLTRVEPGE